jgi:hypothetical protein
VGGPGRRWIPVPQSSPCAAAPSRSLSNMTSRMSAIPARAGRLSLRHQVAIESSPWRSGPQSSPWPRWPVPRLWLACLRSSFIPVSVVAPSRPKTGLWQATRAHRNKPGRRPHAEIPAWAGCKPHPLRVTRRAHSSRGDLSRVRQGSGPRSSALGTLTGRAASCQRGLMPLGQRMCRNDGRGSAVCAATGVFARQGMMASTVFFSALGWAGDLGAFSRARSSLAPSSFSCLRPRPARTLGNQSCSSSSM